MGKKALALLIAMLTVGHSFAMSCSAAFDRAQQTDTSQSAASDGTGTFELRITQDELQRAAQNTSLRSVKQPAINAPKVDTKELTKGYSVDSQKFDLRDVNGKSYTTPVRSQAPFGTCWSFATVAALESSILGAGLNGADGKPADPNTLDLSEKQIAWFSSRPLTISGHPQNGEGQYIMEHMNTPEALTIFMNRGGNAVFSEYALMQGIGPSHESSNVQFEYHGNESTVVFRWIDGKMQKYSYSDADTWNISDDLRFKSDYSVKESHNLPKPGSVDQYGYYTYNEEGTKAIKQELLNLRAVQVAFCADTSMPGTETDGQYISSNWAHYTYINAFTNHAVTIVGWDDNYSKDNFIKGSVEMYMRDGKKVTIDKQPPANGAWLVKNSWGSGENEFPNKGSGNWGIVENGVHTGYFWLSYYDKSLAVSNPVSYVVEQADDKVNNIDQHDYMPLSSAESAKFDKKVQMANRFMASQDEILRQVSCYTTSPETEVTYDIYLLDDFADKPVEGIKVATKKVKYAFSGMHKEDLKDFEILFDTLGNGSGDVALTKYQEYSIVVTQKDKNGKYLMNYPFASDSENGLASFKGIINSQESYVYYDDYWNDYKDCDDLKKEVFDQVLSDQLDPTIKLTYDNFPIKGYTQKLDTKTVLELSGNSVLFYGTKDHSNSTVRFSMHTNTGSAPEIKQSDVKWGMMPCAEEFDKIYVKGEAVSGDPTRYKFSAINTDDKKTRAYFTIKGVGTYSTKVYVKKMAFRTIDFPFNGIEDQLVYSYTGKEIRPCTGVSVDEMIEQFIEGEDFEFIYTDNIKCGLATVDAKPIGDRIDQTSAARAKFVIVPAKPVIKNVTTSGSRLTVEIEDQSESNPSGYRLQYRVKGEEKWQESISKGTSAFINAYGLDGDKEYEVQVRYTEIIDGESLWWYGDQINYGETSEIKTVKTSSTEPIVRISGDNRFATAAKISAVSCVSAETVILANGMNYADALAGVPLAYKFNAPILLTGNGALNKDTFDEIKRLKAKNVIILGGEGAVSKEAEDELKGAGLAVERIAGSSRFSTAAAIAEKLGSAPEEIFFVYGLDYADALSVSSVAAIRKAPVIYLNKDGQMNAETAQYLESLKELECVKNAYVIGGSGVISDDMMQKAATALGIEQIDRISGANRYETCVAVNEKFADDLTGDMICAATGKDFPDALAGGVYAALNKAPMLLVSDSLNQAQKQFIKAKSAGSVTVFGGTGAVSDEAAKQIVEAKQAAE